MKPGKLILICFWLLCTTATGRSIKVTNIGAFNREVKNIGPGDTIILANGKWKDAGLVLKGKGSKEHNIVLCAESPGKVSLEGRSSLRLSGEWLQVSGLLFINGSTPLKTVIDFRTGSTEYAYNSVVTNCAIVNYSQPDKTASDHWLEIWGKNNRVDHCFFSGKTNHGTTLVIWPNDSNCINNNHLIQHNFFGERPPLGVNGGETIRIGTSDVCNNVSASIVRNNYFEHCNGEVEIISNKSCDNQYLNNTFYECEGCLTLRHGNRAIVSGNWFIGNDREKTGGVRVINEGHLIFNNFFYKLRGKDFYSALTIMNGIPDTPANGYAAVKNVTVANNTFFECSRTFTFCAGAHERNRIVRPESTLLVNNLVYCPSEETLFVKEDVMDGIRLENNLLLSKNGVCSELGSIRGSVRTVKYRNLEIPLTGSPGKEDTRITGDIFGNRRTKNMIGAFQQPNESPGFELASRKNCGPAWFKP